MFRNRKIKWSDKKSVKANKDKVLNIKLSGGVICVENFIHPPPANGARLGSYFCDTNLTSACKGVRPYNFE